ncbi:restriction endonuclease subunit S [Paenibacillus riograndensis]|uniref:Restriction modification system DNA specificity domain-containing protein n=1 Tax=Paenibacillus riograndensis SBR5 TaxID=1073571 RepID=A0A0E4H8A0_9BACL|nr:restriction endonuclease subunit S [Paenibacillus riograndensis]CQR52696.1 restriction modification system DNA specificity domain-containing protein [Paenibacillus riograndensis SBR5]
MSKWEKVKLGDVVTLLNGRAYKQDELLDEGATPVLRVGNFFSNRGWYYSDLQLEENKYCDKGDLLYAWSASFGPKIWDGPRAIYHYHIWKIVLSEHVEKGYMYYLLQQSTKAIMNQGRGIEMIHATKGGMEKMLIPLPPLETQKQIANTLEVAAELLAMRKQQLAELDNLIKSTFYDMFGNPVTNEKGWELKHIGDFSMVKIGPFGSLLHVEDYIEDGFPLVNPSHIVGNKIVPDMNLTLSPEKFNELKGYVMEKGDIVVGRRGEIGRCAVVENEGFLCGTGSMFIRIENDFLPMVLQRIISSDPMRSILEHQSVGVTMKNLNAGTISNLVVPMIPLLLQTQFANIVTKIEEQKALVKKAIDETQYLFDSLMSEYFE